MTKEILTKKYLKYIESRLIQSLEIEEEVENWFIEMIGGNVRMLTCVPPQIEEVRQ